MISSVFNPGCILESCRKQKIKTDAQYILEHKSESVSAILEGVGDEKTGYFIFFKFHSSFEC